MARKRKKHLAPDPERTPDQAVVTEEHLQVFVQSFTGLTYTPDTAPGPWTTDLLRVLQHLIRSQPHRPAHGELLLELTEGSSVMRLQLWAIPAGGVLSAATYLDAKKEVLDSNFVSRADSTGFWTSVLETALIRVANAVLSPHDIEMRLEHRDPNRVKLGRRENDA